MGVVHRLPTMSQSALLLSPCIRWAGPVPWFNEDLLDKEQTKERDAGTDTHKALDVVQKTGQLPANISPGLQRMVQHGAKFLWEVLEPFAESVRSEVAVGANWLTGETRELQEVVDRQYPSWDGWQFGTADLVAKLLSGRLWVGDWKTGNTDGAREQLMSLAYALGKATGNHNITICCLPVNDDGVWPHEEDLTWDELEAHADAMRFQWESIGKRNEPSAGVHCTSLYCPHLAYCPDIQMAITQMAKAGPGDPAVSEANMLQYELTDTPASDREAGFVQAMVAAANRRIKYLTAANKERITKGLGKVTFGQYVWEDRGNGFRWHRGHREN